MRLLLVEDDESLRNLTAIGLRRLNYAVDTAEDGDDALESLDLVGYDLVVLDRDFPRVHGDEVCAAIVNRPSPRPRVLMLTAFGSVADRVEGLHLGADDYLAKPFAMEELGARLAALSRRPDTAPAPVLHALDVQLNTTTRVVTRGERVLTLTRKELAAQTRSQRGDGADMILTNAASEKALGSKIPPKPRVRNE